MKKHLQNNFLLKEIAEYIRQRMSYYSAVVVFFPYIFLPKCFFLIIKFTEKNIEKTAFFLKICEISIHQFLQKNAFFILDKELKFLILLKMSHGIVSKEMLILFK